MFDLQFTDAGMARVRPTAHGKFRVYFRGNGDKAEKTPEEAGDLIAAVWRNRVKKLRA